MPVESIRHSVAMSLQPDSPLLSETLLQYQSPESYKYQKTAMPILASAYLAPQPPIVVLRLTRFAELYVDLLRHKASWRQYAVYILNSVDSFNSEESLQTGSKMSPGREAAPDIPDTVSHYIL